MMYFRMSQGMLEIMDAVVFEDRIYFMLGVHILKILHLFSSMGIPWCYIVLREAT